MNIQKKFFAILIGFVVLLSAVAIYANYSLQAGWQEMNFTDIQSDYTSNDSIDAVFGVYNDSGVKKWCSYKAGNLPDGISIPSCLTHDGDVWVHSDVSQVYGEHTSLASRANPSFVGLHEVSEFSFEVGNTGNTNASNVLFDISYSTSSAGIESVTFEVQQCDLVSGNLSTTSCTDISTSEFEHIFDTSVTDHNCNLQGDFSNNTATTASCSFDISSYLLQGKGLRLKYGLSFSSSGQVTMGAQVQVNGTIEGENTATLSIADGTLADNPGDSDDDSTGGGTTEDPSLPTPPSTPNIGLAISTGTTAVPQEVFASVDDIIAWVHSDSCTDATLEWGLGNSQDPASVPQWAVIQNDGFWTCGNNTWLIGALNLGQVTSGDYYWHVRNASQQAVASSPYHFQLTPNTEDTQPISLSWPTSCTGNIQNSISPAASSTLTARGFVTVDPITDSDGNAISVDGDATPDTLYCVIDSSGTVIGAWNNRENFASSLFIPQSSGTTIQVYRGHYIKYGVDEFYPLQVTLNQNQSYSVGQEFGVTVSLPSHKGPATINAIQFQFPTGATPSYVRDGWVGSQCTASGSVVNCSVSSVAPWTESTSGIFYFSLPTTGSSAISVKLQSGSQVLKEASVNVNIANVVEQAVYGYYHPGSVDGSDDNPDDHWYSLDAGISLSHDNIDTTSGYRVMSGAPMFIVLSTAISGQTRQLFQCDNGTDHMIAWSEQECNDNGYTNISSFGHLFTEATGDFMTEAHRCVRNSNNNHYIGFNNASSACESGTSRNEGSLGFVKWPSPVCQRNPASSGQQANLNACTQTGYRDSSGQDQTDVNKNCYTEGFWYKANNEGVERCHYEAYNGQNISNPVLAADLTLNGQNDDYINITTVTCLSGKIQLRFSDANGVFNNDGTNEGWLDLNNGEGGWTCTGGNWSWRENGDVYASLGEIYIKARYTTNQSLESNEVVVHAGTEQVSCSQQFPHACTTESACTGVSLYWDASTSTCSSTHPPVNGGWSAWSSWGPCTASCGGGTQDRTRSCTNPVPDYGGQTCLGAATESQSCNEHACVIDIPAHKIIKIQGEGQWSNQTWFVTDYIVNNLYYTVDTSGNLAAYVEFISGSTSGRILDVNQQHIANWNIVEHPPGYEVLFAHDNSPYGYWVTDSGDITIHINQ